MARSAEFECSVESTWWPVIAARIEALGRRAQTLWWWPGVLLSVFPCRRRDFCSSASASPSFSVELDEWRRGPGTGEDVGGATVASRQPSAVPGPEVTLATFVPRDAGGDAGGGADGAPAAAVSAVDDGPVYDEEGAAAAAAAAAAPTAASSSSFGGAATETSPRSTVPSAEAATRYHWPTTVVPPIDTLRCTQVRPPVLDTQTSPVTCRISTGDLVGTVLPAVF